MRRKNIIVYLIIFFISLALVSCMPGGGTYSKQPAGFFSGIWHGWIAPISLAVGFFNPSVRIYETFNTGWWYDFGFYMALLGGFGGFSLFRKKKKDE